MAYMLGTEPRTATGVQFSRSRQNSFGRNRSSFECYSQ